MVPKLNCPQKVGHPSNFWVFNMNKYTEQFKLTAIKAYLVGSKGLRTVAQRFDIDVSLLRRWVSSYKLHGSISPRKRGQPYSASFKRNVVEYKRTHHLSLRQVAA
ncbi:UNVERIFIED_ORG: transposase-like protein, partial [Pseudomonas psychrophila]